MTGRSTGSGRLRRVVVAMVVVVVTAIGGCTPPPPPTPPTSCRGTGSTTTRDVAYRSVPGVDPNLLALDHVVPVRPAGCGPAPIVVYVHGGGFQIGDKANRVADKARLFTTEGWTFVSVNYRLSPSPPSDAPGQVRHPLHAQDVAAAVAWVRRNAASLGGDPDRIFLMGHSSGAFLTSLLSTDAALLAAAGVSARSVPCTVSLDTEYDIAERIAAGGAPEALYRNAFGNDPAVWEAASPITHTGPGRLRPRFLVVTQGPARRTGQARDFAGALRAGGTDATVLDVNPLTHEEVNQAVGRPGESRLTPPLMTFLRDCADARS